MRVRVWNKQFLITMLAVLLGVKLYPDLDDSGQGNVGNTDPEKARSTYCDGPDINWHNSMGSYQTTNQVVELRLVDGRLAGRLCPFRQSISSTQTLFESVH